MPTAHELLEAGDAVKAISKLLREYSRSKDDLTLSTLGVAYLCEGQLPSAVSAFRQLTEQQPRRSADQYEYLGVALWISGDRAGAVEAWSEATLCGYGDAAGNIGPVLLLYYVAVTASKLFSLKTALALLEKRLAGRTSYYWPGGIARMLVGRIDRAEAEEHKSFAKWTHPYETAELEFYDGAMHRRHGDETGCRARMQACVNCGNVGMFAPVWFLARYELEQVAIKHTKTRRKPSMLKRKSAKPRTHRKRL